METSHKIVLRSASVMSEVADNSVGCVVTSPPYPMIEMWDGIFGDQNPEVVERLEAGDGKGAFDAMHSVLEPVWDEVYRVLIPGGIACINVGDAVRTIGGDFQLYPNMSKIMGYCHAIGFNLLPSVIWRKQTNAPNKFMGSGMLPGAYVTLEHEHVLILRKGGKRVFKGEEKLNRQRSAFFWEERNKWFSDTWSIKGVKQKMVGGRERSGAFPFEIAYRLINMYSVYGDVVLDPFVGTGTTMFAAAVSGRSSIGYEIDETFGDVINAALSDVLKNLSDDRVAFRIADHEAFIMTRGSTKYINEHYGFNVVTRQERRIIFYSISDIEHRGSGFVCFYTSVDNL